MNNNKKKHNNFKAKIFMMPIILIALLTALDQFTKFVITSSMELYESKPVIKDVFAITYIQNRGVAWGMFQGGIPVFVVMTVVVLLVCFYLLHKIENKRKFLPVRYTVILLVAGAIGNMIDRIKLGYVVDFLSFELINFPVFNVADIYVVVSMIIMFILLLFVYSNEDLDEMLGIKGKEEA